MLAGAFLGTSERVARVEELLVGVFGAFVGGEFVTPMLAGGAPPGFTALGLLNAVAAASVLLVLLAGMRRAVGPMRARKKPVRR